MITSHERIARARKVDALVSTLRRLPEPPTSAELERWEDETWTLLAGASRVKPASATTIRAVIEFVRREETRAA